MGFRFDINAYIATHPEKVERDLATYFAHHDDPNAGYTGRHFDELSNRSKPNRFTPDDVAALATLSVPLGARAVSNLLFDQAADLNKRLKKCPSQDAALWEVKTKKIKPGSELFQLYDEIKSIRGIGKARASKLLACKRPNLVPIRDSVVERLLEAGDAWWMPMREAFVGTGLAGRLRDLADGSVDDSVSELRLLDVALWMEGKRRESKT